MIQEKEDTDDAGVTTAGASTVMRRGECGGLHARRQAGTAVRACKHSLPDATTFSMKPEARSSTKVSTWEVKKV